MKPEYLFDLADQLDQGGHVKAAAQVDALITKLAEDEKKGLIDKIKELVSSGVKSLKDLISEHAPMMASAVAKNPDLLKQIMGGVGEEGMALEELLSSLSIEDLALLLL